MAQVTDSVSKVIEEFAKSSSTVKVLALSALQDMFYIQSVLEFGASGFISMDEFIDGVGGKNLVIEAILRVANGEKGILSEKLSQKLFGK